MQPLTDDFYRSIFEGFPGALALVTADGQLRVANRAARMLGVDLESLPRLIGSATEQTTLPLVDRAGAARVLFIEESPLNGDRGSSYVYAVLMAPSATGRSSFSASIFASLMRCTQYVHFSITPRLRTLTSGLRPSVRLGVVQSW